jgi:hypothetical protein
MGLKITVKSNLSDTCIGTSEGYQPRTNIVKDEKGYLVTHTPTVFWLGGGTSSLSCLMFVELILLGKQK